LIDIARLFDDVILAHAGIHFDVQRLRKMDSGSPALARVQNDEAR
jgi:hypothetical protein